MSDAHDHNHPPHLAHHFETPQQQYDSAKLGMWIFLATEILMFGGLFCAYAIFRGNNPDLFLFAHKALDTNLGAINTVVLLASSFTMAWGVRAAQLGQKRLLVGMLLLTLAGGGGFMVIKTIEYASKWEHDIFVGGINVFHPASKDDPAHTIAYIEGKAHGKPAGHGDAHHADDETHADDAHGAEDHAEKEQATDTGDADATDAPDTSQASPETIPASEPDPEVVLVTWPPNPVDHTNTPPPPVAVAGTAEAFTDVAAPRPLPQQLGLPAPGGGHDYPRFEELTDLERKRTHVFFQIYFLMTGLHGLHVLIGMGAIGILTWVAFKGTFGPAYYTPVDLVGLYWHLVDLIWIFLFPLLYLIH